MINLKKTAATLALSLVAVFGVVGADIATSSPAIADPKPCC